MHLEKYQPYAAPMLRIGLALVFLWFGITNIFNPEMLVGYAPSIIYQLPVSALTVMIINGVIEVILALLMLLGFFVRTSAFLYSLHVLGIAFGMGYHDVAVRDIGLAIASFAIFLHGKDQWCPKKQSFLSPKIFNFVSLGKKK